LTPAWARTILRRWNAEGPGGLANRRPAANSGKPKLTTGQQAELYDALQRRPPVGGLWTGPRVAAYARNRFVVAVRPETGWRWLTRLGFSLQVPRPRNPKAATAEEQRGWKRRPSRPDGRAAPRAPRGGHRAGGRG
jgi:transposase